MLINTKLNITIDMQYNWKLSVHFETVEANNSKIKFDFIILRKKISFITNKQRKKEEKITKQTSSPSILEQHHWGQNRT